MAEPQGTVRVRRRGLAVTFHVGGRATAALGLPLRRCAEQALAAGAGALRFDLRRCTHMDSTFLGTLLCLKRAIDRRPEGELALVEPSPQCCRLLEQMGLAGVFAIVTLDQADGDEGTELMEDLQDVTAFKRNVLQAHEELAALPGPAGEQFRAVVRCLAQDPEAQKVREGADTAKR
jgi:anti-anti-sigma regulatory factor